MALEIELRPSGRIQLSGQEFELVVIVTNSGAENLTCVEPLPGTGEVTPPAGAELFHRDVRPVSLTAGSSHSFHYRYRTAGCADGQGGLLMLPAMVVGLSPHGARRTSKYKTLIVEVLPGKPRRTPAAGIRTGPAPLDIGGRAHAGRSVRR